jgi:hypothetical protein
MNRVSLALAGASFASLAFAIGASYPAHAQTPPSGTATVAPAPTTAPATSASTTPPGSSPTATASASASSPTPAPVGSAPAMTPAKVEKARDVAKQAELTPIVPSPKDITRPAFQLYSEVDLPILGIGLVVALSRLIKTQKAFCAPSSCDSNDLNFVDKLTAGFYDTTWATISDVGLYSLMGGSAILLAVDEGPVPALNDAVVIAESALTATAFATMLTLAAGRPRPLLYSDNPSQYGPGGAPDSAFKAPPDVRNGADAGLSFLSSHTAVSFAIGVSTFMAIKRLEPRSSVPIIVLSSGLAAAAVVGVSRVMAGNHFITDVVGGGIIGSSVGVLIPSLHGSPVRVVPVVAPTHAGVGLGGVF